MKKRERERKQGREEGRKEASGRGRERGSEQGKEEGGSGIERKIMREEGKERVREIGKLECFLHMYVQVEAENELTTESH